MMRQRMRNSGIARSRSSKEEASRTRRENIKILWKEKEMDEKEERTRMLDLVGGVSSDRTAIQHHE